MADFYAEKIDNKVTNISSASTDVQYPSAKAVYDNLNKKITQLSTMPTTLSIYLGKVVQYVGTTTTTAPIYHHGYFYEVQGDAEYYEHRIEQLTVMQTMLYSKTHSSTEYSRLYEDEACTLDTEYYAKGNGVYDSNLESATQIDNIIDTTFHSDTYEWTAINVQPEGSGYPDVDDTTIEYDDDDKLRVKDSAINYSKIDSNLVTQSIASEDPHTTKLTSEAAVRTELDKKENKIIDNITGTGGQILARNEDNNALEFIDIPESVVFIDVEEWPTTNITDKAFYRRFTYNTTQYKRVRFTDEYKEQYSVYYDGITEKASGTVTDWDTVTANWTTDWVDKIQTDIDNGDISYSTDATLNKVTYYKNIATWEIRYYCGGVWHDCVEKVFLDVDEYHTTSEYENVIQRKSIGTGAAPKYECKYVKDGGLFDLSGIPNAINDRYLHTNATTGELEWQVSPTDDCVKKVNATNAVIKVGNQFFKLLLDSDGNISMNLLSSDESTGLKVNADSSSGAMLSMIQNTVDDGAIAISGGTPLADNPSVILIGAQADDDSKGTFSVSANDGLNETTLVGTPSGSLKWDNKEVVTANDIANKIDTAGAGLTKSGTTLSVSPNTYIEIYSTMPPATASITNKIVQFTGTNSTKYKNGYFYKCVANTGTVPITYSWKELKVMNSPKVYYSQTEPTDAVEGDLWVYSGGSGLELFDMIYPIGSYAFGQHPTLGTWEEVTSSGRALWIQSDSVDGTLIEQALPNITGNIDVMTGSVSGRMYPLATLNQGGALQSYGSSDIAQNVAANETAAAEKGITLNAHNSNSIYQDGAKVQPKAYVIKVWKRTA